MFSSQFPSLRFCSGFVDVLYKYTEIYFDSLPQHNHCNYKLYSRMSPLRVKLQPSVENIRRFFLKLGFCSVRMISESSNNQAIFKPLRLTVKFQRVSMRVSMHFSASLLQLLHNCEALIPRSATTSSRDY